MTVLNRAALAFSLTALTLGGAVLSPGPTAAQAPASGQTGVGLELSPDQRAKAEVRQTQFQKDVLALRNDPKMTDAQKQDKYTSLYKALDKDMMGILTSAQRKQVEKQRQINAQFKTDVLALQADKK